MVCCLYHQYINLVGNCKTYKLLIMINFKPTRILKIIAIIMSILVVLGAIGWIILGVLIKNSHF